MQSYPQLDSTNLLKRLPFKTSSYEVIHKWRFPFNHLPESPRRLQDACSKSWTRTTTNVHTLARQGAQPRIAVLCCVISLTEIARSQAQASNMSCWSHSSFLFMNCMRLRASVRAQGSIRVHSVRYKVNPANALLTEVTNGKHSSKSLRLCTYNGNKLDHITELMTQQSLYKQNSCRNYKHQPKPLNLYYLGFYKSK